MRPDVIIHASVLLHQSAVNSVLVLKDYLLIIKLHSDIHLPNIFFKTYQIKNFVLIILNSRIYQLGLNHV